MARRVPGTPACEHTCTQHNQPLRWRRGRYDTLELDPASSRPAFSDVAPTVERNGSARTLSDHRNGSAYSSQLQDFGAAELIEDVGLGVWPAHMRPPEASMVAPVM